MASLLLIGLLFLLQFVYLPIGTSFFEGSKVYAAEIVIAVLFTLTLFSKQGVAWQKYNKCFLIALATIFVVSCIHLLTDSTRTVLFGNNFRLQGTVLVWFLLSLALVTKDIVITKKWLPQLVFAALLLQVIFAIFFIGVGTDRPVGTIGEPNALGASVLFLWPFLYFQTETALTKQWMLRIFSLGLVIFIIIISGSRSALIAFGIQFVFLLLQHFMPKKLGIVTLAAIGMLAVSYIFPILSHDVYENRGEIWQSAVVAGMDRPILGVGFGNAEYALHKANVKLHNHLPGYYVDSAHNIFLDMWLQVGIIGVGAFVYLLYLTFRIFIIQNRLRSLVLLLGIIAALSFNPASVVSLIALWWLIGQSGVAQQK